MHPSRACQLSAGLAAGFWMHGIGSMRRLLATKAWFEAKEREALGERAGTVARLERVTVLPFADAMGGLTAEEIHEQLVTPYFRGGDEDAPYRPVSEGEVLRFRHGAQIGVRGRKAAAHGP